MSSHHPSIDERLASADTEDAATLAILAAGRDIAHQLGRIADHIEVEQIVNEAASFGRYPAGHPATEWPDAPLNPNIATRDDAVMRHAEAPSQR